MAEITRRTVLASALATLASPVLWAAQRAEAVQAAALPLRKTFTIGKSVRGRPIKARRIGLPHRPVKIVVVGCIHGNEDDGRRIVAKLAEWTPPSNVVVFLVSTMNPDGNAVSTGNALSLRGRLNARGVNLNRNFPGGRRTGKRGQQTYSGPRDLSEPESRALHEFLIKMRPRMLVVYHQHMNLVDYCGGNRYVQRRYARRTKQKFTQLPRYKGSMATWWHQYNDIATVMTVELDVKTPPALVTRHEQALKKMIKEFAARVPG